MVSRKYKILCQTGLHLRPASDLCNLALNYVCKIEIKTGDCTINAKSLLGVLSACIKYQDEIEVFCNGEDETEALEKITDFFQKDFAV